MSSLTAAHRGYEYQDLLVACRLVDMLLGTVVRAHVDEKLLHDDRFDDLTTVDNDGNRERTQFKHTDKADGPLELAAFSRDDRGLRLDRLIATVLADRSGPGRGAARHLYRVVLRNQPPIEKRLTAVLRPAAADPGPFIHTMPTIRLGFDAERLWALTDRKSTATLLPGDNDFAFLADGEVPISQADLEWACRHLIIEVAAPPASGDLTTPAAAELLLLNRVRSEVGAEAYPNRNRSAVDVAAAMVGTARAARQGRVVLTAEELLRRAQLRQDFGAVSRSHPVDYHVEVSRTVTVRQLAESAAGLAKTGGRLLVVGPPGQGKSWVCQQLLGELSRRGWLTAEHYCYLGDADGERLPRVLAEAVFGSLLGRLAEADPRLVTEQRPRFAADEEALINCVARSLQDEPLRPVALIVDGIDHITRVRPGGGSFDPSLNLAEMLGSLALPLGSVLIVLSQPGKHLKPLEEMEATTLPVPGLDERELHLLAARLGVVPANDDGQHDDSKPLLEPEDDVSEFLTVLGERSAGNALYATYLCREALRHDATLAAPAAALRSFPPFDGTLGNYYQHLYTSVGSEGGWVGDVIALVDFAVSRSELREIRPDMAHRVTRALEVLAPVLVERAAQGGVRIYHESFARFLRESFRDDPTALRALLDRIAAWLDRRGLFKDWRAFRSLLPILAEAGRDAEVVGLVERDFVVRAVAGGFPASSIISNLATAIGSAARIENWPAIIRYIELSRAADTYESERFDTILVEFADIPMALLGANVVASRLLYDDRLVMPARVGLQICAAVDAHGAVAPWSHYMTGFLSEVEKDNTAYGTTSDQQVALAWLRGRLRLAASSQSTAAHDDHDHDHDSVEPSEGEWEPSAPVDWGRLACWLEDQELPAAPVVRAVVDTYGISGAAVLLEKLDHPGDMCLALAELIAGAEAPDRAASIRWASLAAARGTTPGAVHKLLALGIELSDLEQPSVIEKRDRLLSLTRSVQQHSVQWKGAHLGEWLDACAIAARRDTLGLNAAEALISGEGWYRCWLRFAIGLIRAEVADIANQSDFALDAIRCLAGDVDPFSGDPRSCDLYSIHGRIGDTIRRAAALLDDDDWATSLTLLRGVSKAITTTLQGEVCGPLPPDLLLRLAVDGASPTRQSFAASFISAEIEAGAARRYYVDLADYRLLGARLALTSDDRKKATQLWNEACAMLTAYGVRKDRTIYEVLNPLPTLIAVDPARGRGCVALAQPLCERVPLHTDGKGTRQAWERWWELLARADPVALAHLAAPRLLRECNDPNWLLHGALEELWRAWCKTADPVIAGALRLTLDMPLDPEDSSALARLADPIHSREVSSDDLMTLLLARADERPVEYPYSNSDELLGRDDTHLAQINLVAQQANLPQVMPVLDPGGVRSSDGGAQRARVTPPGPVSAEATPCFPAGAVGLAHATRAWRSRPYDVRSPGWALDRFANVIGYRLIELIEAGREEDATAALRSLADATRFQNQAGVLQAVGQGLERHGQNRLAAMALTLAWTRERGGGGWLNFGGEAEIDSLHRATQLDPASARSLVAHEVQRSVAGQYGTYGISQAIIYGFAVGALVPSGASSVDTAFAAWSEAFAVIASRAHASDDPADPYIPLDPEDGAAAPGDLNGAIAVGALAGLAHPAREKKRRTLLAAQLLLSRRPIQAALAFDTALATLSDPATLTWLLRVIELAGEQRGAVVTACQQTLVRLASGRYLTVRALARRLVPDSAPALPPPTLPDRALVDNGTVGLWTPYGNELKRDQPPAFEKLLEAVAGSRLKRAEGMLPGLRNAVSTSLAATIDDELHEKRLRAQLDAFADRLQRWWPDAYLTREQTIEETLQLAATGGRAARLLTGRPITDPVKWEDALADQLLDDPALPLAIEGCRQPRPPIPPPPGVGHSIWSQIRLAVTGVSQDGAMVAAVEREEGLAATLAIRDSEAVAVLEAGRFRGWRAIATLETRVSKHPDHREHRYLLASRHRTIEVRRTGDRQALTQSPVAEGEIRLWRASVRSSWRSPLGSYPIVGLDDDVSAAGDGRRGLGVPSPLLSPTAWLIGVLGLRPGEPFILDADDGPGLALVTWRAEYDTSDHYLARPRLWGAAILMRQAVFDRLLDVVGGDLRLRDFVAGSSDLSLAGGS